MYHVVEFDEANGGVGLIHDKWLTPRKKESFWPPYKFTSQYNKSLSDGNQPETNWTLCTIKRIFYSTDDLPKARDKLKQAENESELQSDYDNQAQSRRRIKPRCLYSSSDEDYDAESESFRKKLKKSLPETPQLSSSINAISQSLSTCADNNFQGDISPITSLNGFSLHTTPIASSTNAEERLYGNAVIARHLAKIDKSISEIKELIISSSTPTEKALSSRVTISFPLPCKTVDDVVNLENWLALNQKNEENMEALLTQRGGKTLKQATSRILESIFANKLAYEYNWTGKNGKKALKT